MRGALTYWVTLALYYACAAALAFVLVRFVGETTAAVLLMVQVVLMSVLTIAALMYEEDWWNDFKEQDRGILLGLFCNVASVLIGAWFA